MSVKRHGIGAVCIYTNRGGSGVTSNDGNRCRIDNYAGVTGEGGQPLYSITFVGTRHGINARHDELAPLKRQPKPS
jgi:hypothetical protein